MDEETLAIFQAEADSLVESLEAGLLALQDRPGDRALIDQVFRDLHTLKGTGGMFGFTELAGFVHGFESAFESLRSGASLATPSLVAVSLKAHDHIVALLAGEAPQGAETLLAELAAAVSGAVGPDAEPKQDLWEEDLPVLNAPSMAAPPVPPPTQPMPAAAEPVTPQAHPAAPSVQAAAVAAQPATPVARSEGVSAPAGGLIRIAASRLDEMMDRVGELVIAEARLAEIAAQSGLPALVSVTEDIQRLATGMRDAAMSIRMTPLSSITGRFRRLVHDLSAQLGKPIDLAIVGEETELDKTVVEQLAEPLMHLIRNAADHGFEDAETRVRLSKPATGRLTLTARHSGTEVLIELADDGKGLDAARIRAKAIERGLLAPNAEIAPADLLRLIFAPGFSTAEKLTEVSGRGVGMDVVRRTVTDLRGRIDLSSEPGQGTRVTLRLPLTLAIIDGLLVEVGGERFIIPLAAVEEIVELADRTAGSEGSSRLLNIRGRLVPYQALRDLLATPGDPGPFQKVVIVTAGESRMGLVVDRIIGSNQTVIKQLSPLHSGLKTFSGATILGDGSVALILEISGFSVPAKIAFPTESRRAEVPA